MSRLHTVDCPHCEASFMYDPFYNKEKEVLNFHYYVCPQLPWKKRLWRHLLRRRVNF